MYSWQVFENCEHPPGRLYAWVAFDEELVVAYCECGAVLCAADEGESE
jgi:hypothetical protein